MKATRTLAALVAASALLGGCASQSSQPYYASNDGYRNGYDNTAAAGYGTIESIQVTNGEGRTSGAGAIVGGLIVSQVLTLYTTPVVYLFFDRIGRKYLRTAEADAEFREHEHAVSAD